VALDRWLHKAKLAGGDRSLVTELVYGKVRRRRSLDKIIDMLAKKPASKQNPDLRIILHLGLYQLGYLSQIPAAAVDRTVELAKENRLGGLAGFVNSLLRQYIRHQEKGEWQLPENLVERLGVLHSYPDWIIELWLEQLGETETEQLCQGLNKPPTIDIRVNILRSTIRELPGFQEGWWMVQDSSAQLVTYLLDPQPDEVVIDARAAPGGKTTHIAELMGDRGTVWACDRSASRLKKLTQNCDRLNLQSIKICAEDIRNLEKFTNIADRVLLDVLV